MFEEGQQSGAMCVEILAGERNMGYRILVVGNKTVSDVMEETHGLKAGKMEYW